MKSKYIMKEVYASSFLAKQDCFEFAVEKGDVILDKSFRLEVLPAAMDFTKPVTRKKLTNAPHKNSERLLRIKELGADYAVVAILRQESSCEGADTLVITETEQPVTVKLGERFSVYAKEQVYDSPRAMVYEFIITDTSKPSEQGFCTECGARLISTDKFCRECGTPVKR